RSVAIAGENLSRSAEIGIVEDVMTSVKLLPGVGYGSSFDAMPSIRGGAPRDLMAVLDGYYIEYPPYHWAGEVSIFDPNMVGSVKLSHGVFSARYGHTISGLLEVTTKQPASGTAAVELGVSTSATNLSLHAPLGQSGSLLLMGKVTYWDPFIWAAKQYFESVRAIKTAPYIRSGAVTANYRFTDELKWTLSGFIGTDGVGAKLTGDKRDGVMDDSMDIALSYRNAIGFLSTGLFWNPSPETALRAALGTGFAREYFDMSLAQKGSVRYSQDFKTTWGITDDSYKIDREDFANEKISLTNYQGRLDFDHELGGGFLAAFGVQELYSIFGGMEEISYFLEEEAPDPGPYGLQPYDYYRGYPFIYKLDVRNQSLRSSAYGLLEYSTEDKSFGAELGLRVDHLHFMGRDFSIKTRPVLNPRLNLDFGILKNAGGVDALSLTLGTGLFSSMDDNIIFLEERSGIDDYELKMNRSWTSVAGTKIEFGEGLSLNLEGYYKYIFVRSYQSIVSDPSSQELDFRFDGQGCVWGFDLMLQKTSARFWEGWISYTFTHARYRNPHGAESELDIAGNDSVGSRWHYPSFHRFHTLNMILTAKPLKSFHITTRFGFASGVPKKEVSGITAYPVLRDDGTLIEKYKRREVYSDSLRGGFSLPLDIKFSLFRFNKKGKVTTEIYFAVENLLSLVYTPKGNKEYNEYTGKEEPGTDNVYEIPIPLPSFGFKWSY
ncbi:MAG: TonB-dependent receptor plug domain-containing protein, partial [Spirochaetaceae bacterium]|nr:TonB-dependent receptor plug domain-containing protein [Spirochaetaceae bacterium]